MSIYFHKLSWVAEEIGFLTLLAIPPSIMSLTEGLQMKLSNVFIGRTAGENVSLMLSSLFLAQVVTTCTCYTISEGLSVCVSILCSRAYGAKQYELIGLYYHRVLLLAVLICFPLFALLTNLSPIIYYFTQNMELANNAAGFTSIYCFAFPAYAYNKITICFLQSQNIVWGPMGYLIIGNIINGFLQYIFIFNYNWGIPGAAAAFVISIYCITLLLVVQIRFSEVHTLTSVELSTDLVSGWIHTLKYTISPMLQTSLATIASNVFPVIILLVISHSNTQLAMYSIMYSIWFAFSLFTKGYSSALTVRIGHLLGEKDAKAAKRSAVFGIIFGETILVVICIGIMLLRSPLSNLFTTDVMFAKELEFNLIILSITIVSDIILFGQGVMNACGMQDMQALFKFIFKFVLGFIGEYFLVRFVTWKALCILCIQCCVAILCFIFSMAIIFPRNWNHFIKKSAKNTKITMDIIGESKYPNPTQSGGTKIHLVIRYIVCLVLGIFVFVAAYTHKIYSL